MDSTTLGKLDRLDHAFAFSDRKSRRAASKLLRELRKTGVFKHLDGTEIRWPRLARLVQVARAATKESSPASSGDEASTARSIDPDR
jgi:hypothetical protein